LPRKKREKPNKRVADAQKEQLGDRNLGERVRQLRARRGWSLESLADASGVSRSMLSQIEREQTNPTLYVVCRIAQAFGMSLGELVEAPHVSSSLNVIRADDHTYHFRSGENYRIRTLSPLNLEKDIEFYEVRLSRGGELRSAPHFEGTREFLTIQKGCVRVESGDDSEILRQGDSASYRADRPHAIINQGKQEAVVFLVDTYD